MKTTPFREVQTIKVLDITDFNSNVSKWLKNHDFEREEDKSQQVARYRHKELPIVIEPKCERWANIHLHDYSIHIVEIIYFKTDGKCDTHSLNQRFDKKADKVYEKIYQAIELGKMFTEYVKKADYIL